MGYPCAVGIAAPLSIVRGAGKAAGQGVIMRTGEAFQAFRSVTRIVLDKTGTLTVGRPVVTEVVALEDPNELLALAAAAEAPSEHPLGQAILTAALDRGLGVAPVDKDIRTDPAALQELLRLGYRATPVTLIDGEAVAGFDRGKIERLLGPA